MNGTTIVTRTAELIQTDVDGDLMALDVAQGNCFGFNATAARVWQLTEPPRSIDAIVDVLTGEFDVDRDACEAAVIGLIGDMADRKLVRV